MFNGALIHLVLSFEFDHKDVKMDLMFEDHMSNKQWTVDSFMVLDTTYL